MGIGRMVHCHHKSIRYVFSVLLLGYLTFNSEKIRNRIKFYDKPLSVAVHKGIKRSGTSIWVDFSQLGFEESPEIDGLFVKDCAHAIARRLFIICEDKYPLPATRFFVEPFDKFEREEKTTYKMALFSTDSKIPGKNGKRYSIQWPWVLRLRWLACGYALLALILFFDVFLSFCRFLASRVMKTSELLICGISRSLYAIIKEKIFKTRVPLARNGNVWLRHGICIVLVVCIASFHFIYRVNGYLYAGDTLRYHAQGRSIVERGMFVPAPMPYSGLSTKAIGQYLESPSIHYPNKGFQLCYAFIAWLRGEFTDISADILNLIMTVGLAFVLYGLGYRLSKSHVMSILLPVGVLFHHIVVATAYNGTAEQGFLFFLASAFWAAMAGKSFLTGVLLGVGSFYREQTLMFIPFVLLLLPPRESLGGLSRQILRAAGGLSIGLALFFICDFLLATSAGSAYYSGISNSIKTGRKFQFVYLNLIPEYLRSFYIAFYPILAFLLVCFIVCYRKLPRNAKILLVMGITVYSVAAFILVPYRTYELRFAVSFIMVLWIILLIVVNSYRLRAVFFAIFIIVNFILSPPTPARNWKAWFSDPAVRWDSVKSRQAVVTKACEQVKSEPVVLTCDGYPSHKFLEKPIAFQLPLFKDFLAGPNNHLVDVIIYREVARGEWPSTLKDEVGYFKDQRGIMFKRLPGIPYNRWGRMNYFIRVEDEQKEE